jgi:predicted nucleic acid-binding protein
VSVVVADASPLILLARSDLLFVLPALFAEVIIPEAVWDEVFAGGSSDPAVRQLETASWPRRAQPAASDSNTDVLRWNLGRGESDVLMLAQQRAGSRALLDDRAGRACARALGIPLLGSGGALVLAKRRGLIPSVGDSLEVMRRSGLWLSDDLRRLLLQKAGEAESR